MTQIVKSLPIYSRFWVALLWVLAATQSVASAANEQPVHDWLSRMVDAVHSFNYEGTFVYLHDNQMETMRVIHTVRGDSEYERLISLNGAAREVIRDNASVTCVTPDSKSVSVGKRFMGQGFRSVFSADPKALSDNYEFRMLGESRVANRSAKVFAIIPKDGYRYGYKIHLDTETALPLKTDMLNGEGEAVSQLMFTALRVDQSIEAALEDMLEGTEHYHWWQQKPVQKLAGEENRWEFSRYLPKGFKKLFHTRRPALAGQPYTDHMVLSDGLATLSVYIEDSSASDLLSGTSRMGAVNAFGIQVSGYHATAVGEVPAATVEAIAKSLEFLDADR